MFCTIFRNNTRIFRIDREYFEKYEHKIKIRYFDLCSVKSTLIHIWAFVLNLSSFGQHLHWCIGITPVWLILFYLKISFRFWLYCVWLLTYYCVYYWLLHCLTLLCQGRSQTFGRGGGRKEGAIENIVF